MVLNKGSSGTQVISMMFHEREGGPGRPWARVMGVAVGSLPLIPRDRTHRVVTGGSARASLARARDSGSSMSLGFGEC